MKKFLSLLLVLLLIAAGPASAAVGIKIASVQIGTATDINFPVGTSYQFDGALFTIPTLATSVSTITSGTIDGAVIGGVSAAAVTGTTVTGVTVNATTSFVAPMLKITGAASTSRPASGATAGTIVAITDSNSVSNCGAAGSGGTTFVVCISDGTNWKKLY